MLDHLERFEAACESMSRMLIDLRNILTWKPASGTLTYGQALAKILAMVPDVDCVTLQPSITGTRDGVTVRYTLTYLGDGLSRFVELHAGTLEDLVEQVRIGAAGSSSLEVAEAEAGQNGVAG